MKAFPMMIAGILLSLNTSAQLPKLLDEAIQKHTQNGEPGIALRIEKDGKVLYSSGHGLADTKTRAPITPNTNFRMASVSKQFTAMAILLLEQDGKISMDDPLSKFFPEIPVRVSGKIKLRHLLNHSSGIIDYESLMSDTIKEQLSDEDVLNMVKTQDSTYFEPGTRFRYSNSAYCLMTLIIEKVSGNIFPDFIKERIFQPLEMKSSMIYRADAEIDQRAMGYARDNRGRIQPSDQSLTSATKGDGGVYTSLNDYAKWIDGLRNNKLINFHKAMEKLKFPITEVPGSSYTAGWFVKSNSPDTFFHSGSTCGFSTFSIQVPSGNLSIVYFSNVAGNEQPFIDIVQILEQNGLTDLSEVMKLHALTR